MKTGGSACWCVILLMTHLISVSRQEVLQIVGASGPIIASVGEDVTLPCSLQPSGGTKIVYVQWFRPQNRDPLVHLHDQGEDSNQNQNPSFNERTGLLSEDLTNGIASLRLRDVQVTDEGEYQCLIQKPSQPHGYLQTLVSLEIRAVGTEPVIFTEAHRLTGVGLLCESKGWYPQPDLIWHDSAGHKLSYEKTEVFRDSRDLFTVRRHIVLQNRGTRRVFCRVFQQKLHQDKVIEFEIHAEMFCQKPWIIFAVILAVILIAFGIFIRHLASLHKRKGVIFTENDWIFYLLDMLFPLKDTSQHEKFTKASIHSVDITLNADTANPWLSISEDGKQVQTSPMRVFPDGPERFSILYGVLGTHCIAAGKHYWEVEVGRKSDWDLGVVREGVKRKERVKRWPTFGFWTIKKRQGHNIMANSSPSVPLYLRRKLQTVGVYVDYENGQVSFYSVEAKQHIYTFNEHRFSGKLYPFFCSYPNFTGKNKRALKIL